nr:transposase [Pseudoalteromonas sp. NBT06-2]
MKSHLKLISNEKEAARLTVVIMDGASWHQEYIDEDFLNLSIIHIPIYSPELNPIEQVYSWLRQNKIANISFKDYDDIVDKCTTA